MIKPDDPRKLAEALTYRSVCDIKVGAVITDWQNRKQCILSWGWNSSGSTGYGEHAEAAAIRRANKKRLEWSTIYVAGRRGNPIYSRPCKDCEALLKHYGIRTVIYTLSGAGWHREEWL